MTPATYVANTSILAQGQRLLALGMPIPRTLLYMAPGVAWRRRQHQVESGVPVRRTTPRMLAEIAADEVARAVFHFTGERWAADNLPRIHTEVEGAHELFLRRGWIEDPRSYHSTPDVPEVREHRVRSQVRRWSVATFPSAWEPDRDEPGHDRWVGYIPNREARSYILRHPDPRPWVVCIHGMRMGRPGMDHRIFRAEHLHHELGLNVILPVLPLHGSRRSRRAHDPNLPSFDAMDTIHGLAQAAHDVRAILAWIRTLGASESEPPPVGIVGTSLGAYVAALVAGLEETPLDCVIAGVPVVDFPAVIDEHLPHDLRKHQWYQEMAKQVTDLYRVVSPLQLFPTTPVEKRFIFAGQVDRVLNPLKQSTALWQHWEKPEICWFEGGHIGHLLSAKIHPFIDDALEQSGVTHRP